MSQYVAAIDQGTTSTRFIVFDHGGNVIAVDQKEHRQIYPQPGWVEHDPLEIWARTQEVIKGALKVRGLQPADIVAIGITNQRETTIIWDKNTGQPIYNAIVWQDTRKEDTQSVVRVTAFFQPEYNFFRKSASITGCHSFPFPQLERNSS